MDHSVTSSTKKAECQKTNLRFCALKASDCNLKPSGKIFKQLEKKKYFAQTEFLNSLFKKERKSWLYMQRKGRKCWCSNSGAAESARGTQQPTYGWAELPFHPCEPHWALRDVSSLWNQVPPPKNQLLSSSHVSDSPQGALTAQGSATQQLQDRKHSRICTLMKK